MERCAVDLQGSGHTILMHRKGKAWEARPGKEGREGIPTAEARQGHRGAGPTDHDPSFTRHTFNP